MTTIGPVAAQAARPGSRLQRRPAVRLRPVAAVPFLCVALIAAGFSLARTAADVPSHLVGTEVLILVPLSVGFAAVGSLILSRHPGHRLGRLYVTTATAMALTIVVFPYAWYGLITAPGAVPGADVVGWVSVWIWTLGVPPALTFGLLLYPDGLLPSRRWWPAAAISGAAIGGLWVAAAFTPGPLINHPVADNPLGIPGSGPVLRVVGAVAQPLILIGLATGIAALVARWRRAPAGGLERRQISLLALASALALAVSLIPAGDAPLPWPVTTVVLAVFALIPTAIGVAILRHHLYDIDAVLNRALVYGGLTVGVVTVYATLVWAAAVPLGRGTWVSLAVTGAAAGVVLPLRNRLQRAVDRAMYGDRGDPYAAVSRLTTRLQAASAPGDALAGVAEAIAMSLRLPYVAVETAAGVAASHGTPSGGPAEMLRLSHQGADVGRLVVEGRDGQPPTSRDLTLLAELARSAGAAVQAAGLADALRVSQRRLVEAREEERRRLRRDLHDGLGPTLAGVVLGLDRVSGSLATDPGGARALLVDLKAETSGAVDDVRRLVYDLRPPALDELGLVEAVRQQAERLTLRTPGLDMRVTADPLPALGAATEVAAYRIAVEAITNAARHAHAHTCAVHLSGGTELRIEVIDDGIGIAPATRPGVGLTAMQERATELGGRITVRAMAPAGTRVLAVLPLEQRWPPTP